MANRDKWVRARAALRKRAAAAQSALEAQVERSDIPSVACLLEEVEAGAFADLGEQQLAGVIRAAARALNLYAGSLDGGAQ